ncbi:AAA family ATPase [Paenibacillus sp. MBLB4367]|uniref:AAA family ATPase n=1 Tax=Paenibacillus sp. MBLB4367 TaxID=3384767 RepID=UPI00390826D4
MTNRKTGLTLGKFAPFHRGHQLVVEMAIAEMDEVIVVIYDCPETTDIPLTVRAGWIRALYPAAEVIEAWDGPVEIGDTPEIKRMHEDYIRGLLGGRRVTHFYSSEFYGDHMSRALGAVNRMVDSKRERVPVSGTAVRRDPFANRAFVHSIVYRDLITSVVFLGAPSTGKTTIAARLAESFQTVWMPEYGREYWEKHQVDRRLSAEQLAELAEGHVEREERMLQEGRDYLFVDTNAITTFMFSLDYHGMAVPRLTELAGQAASRYDLVFVCMDDIPYDDTWDRSGEMHRGMFQKRIIADLTVRKIPFIALSGNVEERERKVKAVLKAYRKYRSIGNLWSDQLEGTE